MLRGGILKIKINDENCFKVGIYFLLNSWLCIGVKGIESGYCRVQIRHRRLHKKDSKNVIDVVRVNTLYYKTLSQRTNLLIFKRITIIKI